ncbi:MAG: preprotein translocase subunit YajC [Clostridia bacterium]|jgi:preprotein translocase subunit YajC|nr:preprotein translocase subunit YajC [Clostridia bacterium]MBQ1435354.1 preprotein translocase subunit YajC [Clostridia bacterium]MBQ4249483.1 preprotein translocase subunit YajC [Clostridia bacterium]
MENFQAFIPLILIVAVMYFLMIRPQQRKQKEINEMRKNIKRGDKVQSAGGVVGRVIKIKDDIITIECGRDRVRLDFVRNALTVLDPAPAVTRTQREQLEQADSEDEEAYEDYTVDETDESYDDYDFDEDYTEGDYTDEYDGGEKK